MRYNTDTSDNHSLLLGYQCHHGKVRSRQEFCLPVHSIRCRFGGLADTESFPLFPWSIHDTLGWASAWEVVTRSSKCITATTSPVIGIIEEMAGPRRTGAPTSTWASYSLALRAALCLPKAKTILHVLVDLSMCLNSPLVAAASTSVVGVIPKRLGPSRAGTPSAASERCMDPGTGNCVQFLWNKSWNRLEPSIVKASRLLKRKLWRVCSWQFFFLNDSMKPDFLTPS